MARGFLAPASVRIGSLLFAMWVMIGAGCTSSESVAPLPAPSAASPTSSNKSTPVIRAAAEIRQSQLMPLAPIGPPVDLLARVDTGRDAVRGVFVRQGKDVLIPAVRAAQLNVVSPLKPQYMLEMDVAKTSTGPGSLNLGFFVDGAIPAALIIDGWDKPVSAICSIDGRIGENNVSTRPLHVFTDSRVRTVRITVRNEGVFAELDGQPLVQFVGAKSQLSFDRRFFTQPLPNQLMLGGWEAEFRVSRWVLTPIGEPPLDLIGRPWATDRPRLDGDQPPAVASNLPRPNLPAPGEPGLPRPSNPELPVSKPASNVDMPERRPEPSSGEPAPSTPTPFEPKKSETVVPPRIEVEWRVEADPFPGWDGSIAPSFSMSFRRGNIVRPDGPSPFVMLYVPANLLVVDGKREKPWAQAYDLRTGKSVGKLCRIEDWFPSTINFDLSGRYFAATEWAVKTQRFDIYSFVTGERVFQVERKVDYQMPFLSDQLASNHTLVHIDQPGDTLQLECIDLRTGTVRNTIDTGMQKRSLSWVHFSPGGRYALLHFDMGYTEPPILDVIELASGTRVGRMRAPPKRDFSQIQAFNRDGTILAYLLANKVDGGSDLWCIDWVKGTTLSLQATEGARTGGKYSYGHWLDWFGDDELLLNVGKEVIDRRSGRLSYVFQRPGSADDLRVPISRKSMLELQELPQGEGYTIRAVNLDQAALNRSLEEARRGVSFHDVGLPKLTTPPAEAARQLTVPAPPTPPSLSPAPRETFPESAVERSVRLTQFGPVRSQIEYLDMAEPPLAVAVAQFQAETGKDRKSQRHIVRHDLLRGDASSMLIYDQYRLAAVGPEGALVVAGEIGGETSSNERYRDFFRRLDVLDLTKKKHVVGWRPYLNEPSPADIGRRHPHEDPRLTTWVRLIDREHVLTLNTAGKLICWELPSLRIAYQCDDVGEPLTLSPNRRYLVVAKESRLHLLDVVEGSWAGTLKFPTAPEAIFRAGFSSDQAELAVLFGEEQRREIGFFDLRNGELLESFSISNLVAGVVRGQDGSSKKLQERSLRPVGEGFWLLNGEFLVDRRRRTIVWEYSAFTATHPIHGPDERVWLAELGSSPGNAGRESEWFLTAHRVPSTEVLSIVRDAGDKPLRQALGRSCLSQNGEAIESQNSP